MYKTALKSVSTGELCRVKRFFFFCLMRLEIYSNLFDFNNRNVTSRVKIRKWKTGLSQNSEISKEKLFFQQASSQHFHPQDVEPHITRKRGISSLEKN